MSKAPKTAKSTPVALGNEEPEIRTVVPLTWEERTRLRELFADPVFRKAWNNAQAAKPSVLAAGLEGPTGLQIGNNRLHQLQGWEMFRAALLREQLERKPAPARASDSFPDAGTMEAEAKRQIESQKKKP